MFLQKFAHRTRWTYVKDTGRSEDNDILSNEKIDERIITLQLCNNVMTDDIIAKYLRFGGVD